MKYLHPDYLVLLQFVAFLFFYFLSHNSYKTPITYFSFLTFFGYWLIKIVFAKEIVKKDGNVEDSNGKED